MTDCFLGLGGNYPQTFAALERAVNRLAKTAGIKNFKTSSLYRTTPVSDIPQADFLNAVCYFESSLSADTLLKICQQIENDLGKEPKTKNAPRLLDLDLLFYGTTQLNTPGLTLPHPHWHERLFVLIPLLELLNFPIDLKNMYEGTITPLKEKLPYAAS